MALSFRGRKLKLSAAVAALCLAAAAWAVPAQAGLFDFFNSNGKEQGPNLQIDIDAVKQGVLPQYSTTVRVGPGLEHYFDCTERSGSWSAAVSPRAEHLVYFRCRLKSLSVNLKDLGLLESLGTISSMLNMMIESRGRGNGQSLSEAGDLVKKASSELQGVDLKAGFVMSVVEPGKFEPHSLQLTLNYPAGSADFALELDKFGRILRDEAIFKDGGDPELLKLIASMPMLYRSTLQQQSEGSL